MAKRPQLSDQFRAAIDASDMSRAEVSRRIELSESTMSRFMSGECGLSVRRLDDLADLLGLHLTTTPPKRITKKGR